MSRPNDHTTVGEAFDLSDRSLTRCDGADPSGGHGLVSTTHDYARFCLMLAGGGQLDGVRILSSKTLAYMTENHLPEYVPLPPIDMRPPIP